MKTDKSQSGQALIELIIFLPLMFMIYSLISGFANAINGSINQQKVTRAYFYYRIQHNPMTPKPDRDQTYQNWQRFGMFFIGWKQKFLPGNRPAMPCYRISIPIEAAKDDQCDQAYSEPQTQFMRVGTVYGFCGGTYTNRNRDVVASPNRPDENYLSVVDPDSCLIQ